MFVRALDQLGREGQLHMHMDEAPARLLPWDTCTWAVSMRATR